jgi:L-cysteine/cystine lyase
MAERGLKVAPRGRSTLVSWESPDPEADAADLRQHGVVVRYLPGWPYVRASVGAWNDEDELARLLDLVA